MRRRWSNPGQDEHICEVFYNRIFSLFYKNLTKFERSETSFAYSTYMCGRGVPTAFSLPLPLPTLPQLPSSKSRIAASPSRSSKKEGGVGCRRSRFISRSRLTSSHVCIYKGLAEGGEDEEILCQLLLLRRKSGLSSRPIDFHEHAPNGERNFFVPGKGAEKMRLPPLFSLFPSGKCSHSSDLPFGVSRSMKTCEIRAQWPLLQSRYISLAQDGKWKLVQRVIAPAGGKNKSSNPPKGVILVYIL